MPLSLPSIQQQSPPREVRLNPILLAKKEKEEREMEEERHKAELNAKRQAFLKKQLLEYYKQKLEEENAKQLKGKKSPQQLRLEEEERKR